jgi:hypothetical protein
VMKYGSSAASTPRVTIIRPGRGPRAGPNRASVFAWSRFSPRKKRRREGRLTRRNICCSQRSQRDHHRV